MKCYEYRTVSCFSSRLRKMLVFVDLPMMLNLGKFEINGRCGYVPLSIPSALSMPTLYLNIRIRCFQCEWGSRDLICLIIALGGQNNASFIIYSAIGFVTFLCFERTFIFFLRERERVCSLLMQKCWISL